MNRIATILKKSLKAALWVLISFVFLFSILAVLIQIPPVQNRLINFAVSAIREKTLTRVDLKKINISFPKSIIMEGLYLEDLNKDTLIYAGEIRINIAFKELFHSTFHIKSFSLVDANLKISRLKTDSLFNYNFIIAAFGDTAINTKPALQTPTKWRFSIDDISMKNVQFQYDDEYAGIIAEAGVHDLKLAISHIDLVKFLCSIDELVINNLNANVLIKNQEKLIIAGIHHLKLNNATLDLQNNLNISVKSIDLEDNSLAYRVLNQSELKKTFDPDNFKFDHITLAASELFYSSAKIEASIKEFTTVDQNNFSITKFKTDFRMDQHSISAKKLNVETTNSAIDADLVIQYSSLKSLKDSLQSAILHIDMKTVSIRNSDLTYFNPRLHKQTFFKNGLNTTTISGSLNGAVNKLNGNDLVITTGEETILKTDISIEGLPDLETMYFNFPNLKIVSGRKDIEMLTGPYVAENIELPEKVSVQIVFKGQLNSFESTVDLVSSNGAAEVNATLDRHNNFSCKVNIVNFDIGGLLKSKEMFGPVSLRAETNGHISNNHSLYAKIKAEVSRVYVKNYTYHNLNLNGTINGREFEGKIDLNDENAVFDIEGLINLNPNEEQFKFRLNVPGVDLQKLNLTKDDIRVGLIADADFKRGTANGISGKAEITNIIITSKGKTYVLDSILFALTNEANHSELSISSALIGVKYTGTVSPEILPSVFSRSINWYFPFSDAGLSQIKAEMQAFNFEIQLHNHPILSEILLPQLIEFEPGLIQGSFDQAKNELKLNATIKKIVYGTTEITDFAAEMNSEKTALNYKVSCHTISNSQINLDNFLLEGKLADKIVVANISSIDEKQNKKLQIRFQISKHEANYRFTLDPVNFFLMNNRWDIAADNYIEFGKQGFLIHHLFINRTESQINIASVNDQFNDDLGIVLKNFRLDDISSIIGKDTTLVKGNVDGNVLLKRVGNTFGLIADAKISNLVVREIPIGQLTFKATNPIAGKFDVDVNFSGTDNHLTATGFFIPGGGENSINLKTTIQSLSMKTIEAFSMGTITEASGILSGDCLIQGKINSPEFSGELVFNNTFVKPAALNSRLELKHEIIIFNKNAIQFKSFTISDINQHTAMIDGTVQMKQFKDFYLDLQVNTKDFLLFNTTVKGNKEFYGKMIIDSKIDVSGPMALPAINAKIKIKKGSNFTFAVPEERLTTDKGDGVVEFVDLLILNPILSRTGEKALKKSLFTGFDLSSIIEIDKQATLRLLLDPASADSLVVKGEAGLSFTLDRSGKMSLTGVYALNEGSYLVSLESVIKRKFDIIPGSTIIWNGEPLDAEVSINANYSVQASPFDLMADQMTGLNEADKGGYKRKYPFLVLLKLRGEILHPEISFEIQLSPADQGILGGAVNQQLDIINADASALNKQVFALLVLGRFIQENPLLTESDGTSALVRSTVGKFLSAQLNQLSSKIVPGVELNFDVQSYNDYQTGQAQGRTQVEIGLKKQLFNDRLSIHVGGTVDVEGEKAKQNSASDITSDMTVEYKLSEDGRYRIKAFRHNQYEGAIEGQLVETGAGVLFVRDFDKWKEIFSRTKNSKSDSWKKQ